MPRYKDITGMRFGKLTAIEYVGKDAYNNALWKCKCDCGNETVTRGSALRKGEVKSCGCLHAPNLSGQRFGRLIALEMVGADERRHNLWKCQCDCGEQVIVTATSLITGHTKSCGCLMRETVSKQFTKHGESKSRLHTVWMGMINRCEHPSHKGYQYYGGRGIKVCDEWRQSYEAFRDWALANGYDENAPRNECTIDRIDVDGDYEPSNCRWADAKTQANNQRPRKIGFKKGHYRKRNSLKGEDE